MCKKLYVQKTYEKNICRKSYLKNILCKQIIFKNRCKGWRAVFPTLLHAFSWSGSHHITQGLQEALVVCLLHQQWYSWGGPQHRTNTARSSTFSGNFIFRTLGPCLAVWCANTSTITWMCWPLPSLSLWGVANCSHKFTKTLPVRGLTKCRPAWRSGSRRLSRQRSLRMTTRHFQELAAW